MNQIHRLLLVLFGKAIVTGRRRSAQGNATWSDRRESGEVVKRLAYSTWNCGLSFQGQ